MVSGVSALRPAEVEMKRLIGSVARGSGRPSTFFFFEETSAANVNQVNHNGKGLQHFIL